MRPTIRRPTGSTVCLIAALVLGACGGETADETPRASDDGSYERTSFVLCPALEAHRAELATIVGFEQDADRGMAGLGAECFVRGRRGNYLRVSLAPAMARSVSMAASSYEGEVTPVPALGNEARFVASGRQPHVLFPMGSLIVDITAENDATPTRETMVELALRVRELLVEANS